MLRKVLNKIKNNAIISMAIFLMVSVVYYGFCYFKTKEIVFDEANIFILIILAICIICVSFCLIVVCFKNKALTNLIISIKTSIENLIKIVESNDEDNIDLHFVTQDILLKIKSDIGGIQKNDERINKKS